MKIAELIRRNRSYRRFDHSVRLSDDELEKIVDAARLSASARNAQPLKYILSNTEESNAVIYDHLAWAAALKDWDGPIQEERPTAYIIQLLDRTISQNCLCDDGISAQSMLLQAVELGYGGCILASVKRDSLSKILELDTERFTILNVIALGRPVENVVIEEMKDDFRYWRDENQTHHVPKRAISEIIFKKI